MDANGVSFGAPDIGDGLVIQAAILGLNRELDRYLIVELAREKLEEANRLRC